ncbi:MAG TPA: 2,3-bisphosphoglycerate-independent phosphoglycerate mutase, partial [Gemmatimonadaceae bacterium]|nr:2,3-bisphosphoglycerate-independent phosphoglycerate mutase [Gemmatimonadaceae bacterium]
MAASSRPTPVVLLVLDGWGYRAEKDGNAIAMATVPTWDRLWARAPRTLLEASGEAVGLPCGQIGNSEVGHLNLGAGRVVKQDLVRISQAIADGSFFTNPVFVDACRQVKKNGGTLHLVGLIGTGGVHAIDTHLLALLDLAEREGVPRVAVQVMLDGRDTMPRSGLGYLEQLVRDAAGRAVIGSVGGRYFGMDRDHRWERTGKWY